MSNIKESSKHLNILKLRSNVKMLKCLNVKMTERGVSIYLAIMIMFILLAIGLRMSVIIVSQMKMIKGMGDSVIAFYAADTGIGRELYEGNDPGTNYSDSLDNGSSYTVAVIAGGTDDCPAEVSLCIKSTGTFRGTKRAIEVTRILPYKAVFVTSNLYYGNLGGLSGADNICENLAENVGLADLADATQNFRAWLSDGTTSAASRLSHSTISYRRVDGALVANNWTDLTNGSISNSITIDEFGNLVTIDFNVWTNSLIGGEINDPVDHCNNWTTNVGAPAFYGQSGSCMGWTDSRWTNQPLFAWPCDIGNGLRLYCFEQ